MIAEVVMEGMSFQDTTFLGLIMLQFRKHLNHVSHREWINSYNTVCAAWSICEDYKIDVNTKFKNTGNENDITKT